MLVDELENKKKQDTPPYRAILGTIFRHKHNNNDTLRSLNF